MGTWSKRLLGAGIITGAAYTVWRVLDERSRQASPGPGSLEWTPQPFPAPPFAVPHPPEPADAASTAPGTTAPETAAPESIWLEPDGDHCPATHPVKAKIASGIYHVPGGQMYDRTVPDRCYRDAAAADADGLRASKR